MEGGAEFGFVFHEAAKVFLNASFCDGVHQEIDFCPFLLIVPSQNKAEKKNQNDKRGIMIRACVLWLTRLYQRVPLTVPENNGQVHYNIIRKGV